MKPRETICQYRLGPILIKFDQSEARLRVFVVGCTWKRLPGSRSLYGDDLLASGALLLPKPCAAFKSSVLRCWKPRRQLFLNSFIHFMSIMYQDKLRTAEQSIQRLKLDLLSETNARTELAAGWLLGWCCVVLLLAWLLGIVMASSSGWNTSVKDSVRASREEDASF